MTREKFYQISLVVSLMCYSFSTGAAVVFASLFVAQQPSKISPTVAQTTIQTQMQND
jgi:hypothetical protein